MGEKFHFQAKGMPLIKFQDADKIKSLQSGKIYAKTLGYYRKREETGDCEVGDKYEGMIHINEATIYCPDTGEVVAVNDDLLKTSESIQRKKNLDLQINKKKKCFHLVIQH